MSRCLLWRPRSRTSNAFFSTSRGALCATSELMPIWTIAKKELRLFLRDPRALIILLAMPVLFILVLGVSLGEGFGQKPDDRLRISLVDLDEGMSEAASIQVAPYGRQPWSEVV